MKQSKREIQLFEMGKIVGRKEILEQLNDLLQIDEQIDKAMARHEDQVHAK